MSHNYENSAYLKSSNISNTSELQIEVLPYNSGDTDDNFYDHDSQHRSVQSYRSEFPESEFESNAGFRVSFYSFLKEVLKNKDPFLNFELKIALEHYSDREEFKKKLMNFFYKKNIMNNSYHRNLLPWRNC